MVFSHAGSSLLARHDSAAPSPDAWFLNVLLDPAAGPPAKGLPGRYGPPIDESPANHATPDGEAGDVLLLISHQALLSGLCEFIPVPFVDDVAGDRVRRSLVAKLLERRGRALEASAVKPLYAGPPTSGLARVTGFAKSLVFKPVKKLLRTVFLFVTVRRAVLRVAEALLLGRSLDRRLAAGGFADGTFPAALKKEAAALEAAVRGVLASPERRGLVRLVRLSFRTLRKEGVDGPPTPDAIEAAVGNPEAALSGRQRDLLGRASEMLRGALATEDEAGGVLAQLDAAVDKRLGRA